MHNSILCIAKSYLLLLCDRHKCCNAFIASVTIHYLSCMMGAKCRSPRLLGSRLGKWGCPSERQSISLMPNCSMMNTPFGILRDLTIPSSCTVCSYMLPGRDRGRQRGSSTKAVGKAYPGQIPRQTYPPYNWWAIGPLGKKLGTYTHEVYLLRRSTGPPPCGPQLREEAIQDILSSLMRHLWRLGVLPCWKRTNALWPLPPTSQSGTQKLSPGPVREEAHMMRPSGRPGKLTSRH